MENFKVNQVVSISAANCRKIKTESWSAMYDCVIDYLKKNPEVEAVAFKVVNVNGGEPRLLPMLDGYENNSGLWLFKAQHCYIEQKPEDKPKETPKFNVGDVYVLTSDIVNEINNGFYTSSVPDGGAVDDRILEGLQQVEVLEVDDEEETVFPLQLKWLGTQYPEMPINHRWFPEKYISHLTPVFKVEKVEAPVETVVKPRVRISASGRRQFSYEFKLAVVSEYKGLPKGKSNRKGTMELLKKYNISATVLKYWVKQQSKPEGFSYPVAWSRSPDSVIKGVN